MESTDRLQALIVALMLPRSSRRRLGGNQAWVQSRSVGQVYPGCTQAGQSRAAAGVAIPIATLLSTWLGNGASQRRGWGRDSLNAKVEQMPAPELENEDPKPNQAVQPKEEEGKAQRVVSWQDGVDGKSLFTVREFEPSETALSDDEDSKMAKPRMCCSVM